MLLIFWPLPPFFFISLLGLIISCAVVIAFVFPQYSKHGFSFVSTLYSVCTLLFMGYSLWQGNTVLWHWNLYTGFIELLLFATVLLGIYSLFYNRLNEKKV